MPTNADLEDLLQFRVGTDIIPEFVVGHTVTDVVRELVQNEFDGGGEVLEVNFGEEALEVVGSGRPIDEAGWLRLSVMLSTGAVAGAGSSQRIPAKSNGIGSKNMGMRTLFLFGPRIEVYSNGLMTILDLRRGTLPRPAVAPDAMTTRSVLIRVAYRTKTDGRLGAFTIDREARALREMRVAMSLVLPKLALPGIEKGMRRMTVRSVRTGIRLEWRQSARIVERLPSQIVVVQRDVHLGEEDGTIKRDVLARREIAFEKEIARPPHLRGERTPSYFDAARGRIRIGVSVSARGKRIDPNDQGRFYYPIVAPFGASGNAVSVSAPFLMNEDRTDLIDHPANDALQESAAKLVAQLLRTDWLDRFGASALAACSPGADPSTFAEAVTSILRDERVWPSRESRRGVTTRRRSTDLVLSDIPNELFLSADQYPAPEIEVNQELRHLLESFGTKRFTLNSLVRLRCAPEDRSLLQTQLQKDEADIHFVDYERALGGAPALALQRRMARVLEGARLSFGNKADLGDSKSTLAADGRLAVVRDLWFVPHGVDPPGLTSASRIHPGLSSFKVLARLGKQYTIDRWIQDVCDRAREGDAATSEIEGLFRFLVARPAKLTPRAVASIRRSPVVKDHRGAWVAASELVLPTAAGARLAEPVLKFPSLELRRRPQVLRRLAVRSKLRRADLLAFAESIQSVQDALLLVGLLKALPSLATSPLFGELSDIPCIPTSAGTIEAPRDVYVDDPDVRSLVPSEAVFATRVPTWFQRRLGCKEEAISLDILARLRQDGQTAKAVPGWEARVIALADAARRERRPATQFANESICWSSGHGWVAPTEVLVGASVATAFHGLPVVRGPVALVEALAAMGAARRPQPSHWARAVRVITAEYQPGARLRKAEIEQLRQLYGRMSVLDIGDIGLGVNEPYLLSTAGTLHDRRDAAARRFVINDQPALASALVRHTVSLALADDHENSQLFFRDLAIPTLTELARTATIVRGAERPLPANTGALRLLDSMHSPNFASAIAAVVRFEAAGTDQRARPVAEISRRLSRLNRLTAVESIQAHVQVANVRVEVPRPWSLATETLFVTKPSTRDEVVAAAAMAVADLIDVGENLTPRIADAAYRLIDRSPSAMQAYLQQRGVEWRPNSRQRLADDVDNVPIDVIQAAVAAALAQGSAGTEWRPVGNRPPGGEGHQGKPLTFPPLETVAPTFEAGSRDWTPPERNKRGGGGGGGGGGRVADPERDAAIGRRGEEIVLAEEKRRLAARGQDPALAIWIGNDVPGADHDIQSVDAQGKRVWIEVKSTIGSDGRFHWPVEQVTLAINKRERYVLCRVYEVASTAPVVRAFVDPIKLLAENKLRVDVSNLLAEVEPMGARGRVAT